MRKIAIAVMGIGLLAMPAAAQEAAVGEDMVARTPAAGQVVGGDIQTTFPTGKLTRCWV